MLNSKIDLKRLTPDFSEEEMQLLKAFADFNAPYEEMINDQLRQYIAQDEKLGFILKLHPVEEQKKQDAISRKLQREAIYDEKWEGYISNLIAQGTFYAQAGLLFEDWYNIIRIYRSLFHPLAMSKLDGDFNRAGTVLQGLNIFIDYAMRVIAEAYFIEKNNLIWEEQRRKEALIRELQESEEKLRVLYENSSDHIFMVDGDGFIRFINHVAPGLKRQDVIGSNIFDYQTESNRSIVKKAIESVFATSKPSSYETTITTPAGAISYSCSVGPMLKDGKVYGAAIIARDISEVKQKEAEIKHVNENLEKIVEQRTRELREEVTQRKNAELKINELNKELKVQLDRLTMINKELESFSYTVSHDLRAPLRAIDGYSKVLSKKMEGKLDGDQKRYLSIIQANVGKMGVLIDDLLAFSRMGRVEKRMTFFDVGQLVHQVCNDLKQSLELDNVEFKIESELISVPADREMMKHVVANLIQNAIKFSSTREKSLIEIGCAEAKGDVTYYVKDNGVGFEMEYADKLFGIFQRLHSDEEFEGTGVGLAIVQRIVHRHGGKVWADAVVDKGATFYFSLPKSNENDKGEFRGDPFSRG